MIDARPHHDFTPQDRERLRELARMASDRLELRRIEIAAGQAASTSADSFESGENALKVRFDEQRGIVACSRATAAMFGYRPGDVADVTMDTLIAGRDRTMLDDLIARITASQRGDALCLTARLHGQRKDGTEFALRAAITGARHDGRLVFDARLEDMSARRYDEQELHRLANTDMLTGLANRAHFYRRVEATLTVPSPAAVLLIDVEGFREVNASLGHAKGDRVLREIADRLKMLARPNDTVARFGGDEFAMLVPRPAGATHANEVAAAVTASLAEPILVDGQEVRVRASCGLAVAPLHAHEPLELIGNADMALSRAKSIGPGRVCAFDPAFREEAVARRLCSIELHRAVGEGEFVVFYQPQFRLADGSLAGAEALIRWLHPQRGLLLPSDFLHALETGPLAAPAGWWILDEACSQAASWRRRGATDFRVSVNLFAAQIRAEDLVAQVFSALARHGLPPHALEIEVTENIVLDHNDKVHESLRCLREHGIGIAFDDFGTGYASLSLLKHYPVSRIKIDRSFVRDMPASEKDTSVIRAILDMARSFGLETIAEGVETEEQRDRLQRMGCEQGQGYLLGRPTPGSQFAETFGITAPA